MVTSANSAYHLHKSLDGFYQIFQKAIEPVEAIEDNYIRPLVTGADAKRYQVPKISTYLLFPYDVTENTSVLAPLEKIAKVAPKTHQLLKKHEALLRNRENPKMDRDDKWWGYVYPKNQVEQAKPKIMIASTATEIRAFVDATGEFAPDDRRVYSVVPTNSEDIYYLLGLLNSPLHTFLLKKWARPKANGFYDIETQFLAPLPIPPATPEQKQHVGELAKRLQELHTERRDKLLLIDQRLSSDQTAEDKDFKKALKPDMAAIDMRLHPGAVLSVEHSTGEIRFLVGGVPVIKDIFVNESAIDFLVAQWRHIARTTSVTEKFTGKKLFGALEKVRKTDNAALKSQVVRLDQEIRSLDQEIETAEAAMNDLVYKLYELTAEEIVMVEGDGK